MSLYRETPCDGCEMVGIYGGHVRAADNENGFERCPGSGGSREEVTIDYEGFHKALYEWYHSERPMSSEIEKELLNVALGVTEDE